MGRNDFYKEHVRQALEKDGWRITHDPMKTPFDDTDILIDFGAERTLLATKERETIAVEVKNFLHPNEKMNELNRLIGQYANYLKSFKVNDPNRKAYIAVTEEAYLRVFCMPMMAANVIEYNMRFIIFNPYTCKIISWK
jgi:hypothetical protein